MACDTPGEFYIDDTKIDSLEIDGQEVDFLEIDGVCVWVKLIPTGLILDEVGQYEWDVPSGCTEVHVCMVGGGGSGASYANMALIGGGFAGDVYDGSIPVTPSSTIPITIGVGGASVFGSNGKDGEDTVFGTVSAAGGRGGDLSGFQGNGEEVTTCLGTNNNGLFNGHEGWGGQSSGLGKGGNAVWRNPPSEAGDADYEGEAGGVGAGGGACQDDIYGCASGIGGRGHVKYTWGDTSSPQYIEYTWSTMSQEDKDKLGIRKIS
jgi:hypothetical protein